MKMKKADGTMAKNDMENTKVFEDHFKKLFNNTTGTNYDPKISAELTEIDTDPTLDKTPTRAEIKKALAKRANEKLPGPNGITTEVYKNLQGNFFNKLEDIIKEFWNNPNCNPEEWAQIGLTIIPKKVTYQTQTSGEELR